MQFRLIAVIGATAAMAACGGGADTSKAPATQQPAAAAAPAAQPAPITGKTLVVQMVGDPSGYRFEPSTITIKTGDGIRFEGVAGGPHNVTFDGASLSPAAKAALVANMPNQDMGELSSKLIADKETYTVSFGNVQAGTYVVTCTPHTANNMKLTITVQ